MSLFFRTFPALVVLVAAWAALPAQERAPADASGVEFFEKRIRPLLAENCYQCHTAAKKRSGLVLESVAGMLKGGERGPALVPGHPEQSLLVRAIEHDGELHMPPKGKLSAQQIADVTAWIKRGAPVPKEVEGATLGPKSDFDLAERKKHWAYQPIKTVALPAVKNPSWCKSLVDYFILNRLEKAGLSPAEPADRRALIRRATFDLIGLPPTPHEVDAFLADASPTAFAKVVDRLLASPHYGERWARHWLDLVRYAETLGFEFDYDLHNAWRYRDYVIRAFNADLPYDQFVIEHLAGDLVPQPRRRPGDGTNESILATGFFWMGEARQTPVDIRQEQADVIDNQIDVLTKALLAQTVACARCHDHKFDAIPTKDYYSLVGYLKSSRYQQAFIDPPERSAAKLDEMASLHSAIRELVSSEIAPLWLSELDKAHLYLPAATGKGQHVDARLDPARAQAWQKALQQIDASDIGHPLHAWAKLATVANYRESRNVLQTALAAEDKASRSRAAVRPFEDFRQESFAGWHVAGDAFGRGPVQPGDVLLGDSASRPVTQFLMGGAHSGLLSNRLQGELRSQTFTVDKRYVHVRLAGRSARVNLVIDGNTLIMNPIYGGLTLPLGGKDGGETGLVWRTMPVDRWVGHRGFFEISDSTVPMQRLNPPPSSARVPEGPQDGAITVDRIVFSDDPSPPPAASNGRNLQALGRAKDDNVPALAAAYQALMIEEVKRWQAAAAGRHSETGPSDDGFALLNWLVQNGLLDGAKRPDSRLDDLLKKYRQLEAALPAPQRAPALADGTGEDEHVFLRGNYKTLGPLAPRGPPVALGSASAEPFKADAGSGRLHLARSLVDPSNPLLARVLVNRLWHHHFGQGLVRTPDDFGRMGQSPTHPELLDALASAFIQAGWSIKAMHRQMLLSATYQMASRADPAHEKLDPENQLLHRMNIRRLEGEAIRDAVLTVSGRLDPTLYGPSVLPYLTKHMEGRGRPNSGPLDGDGRRSIYLNVRRNFLTPMLVAFDYPTTFTTMGRRGLTSVPAQALTLMNDPFVVQQAQLWAERTLAKSEAPAAKRIDSLYRSAFARLPSEAERANAMAFIQRHSGGADDLRAWADLCHVLMNVKEFIFLD